MNFIYQISGSSMVLVKVKRSFVLYIQEFKFEKIYKFGFLDVYIYIYMYICYLLES